MRCRILHDILVIGIINYEIVECNTVSGLKSSRE